MSPAAGFAFKRLSMGCSALSAIPVSGRMGEILTSFCNKSTPSYEFFRLKRSQGGKRSVSSRSFFRASQIQAGSSRGAHQAVTPVLSPSEEEMFYSAPGILRAAERRTQSDWLAQALANPTTRIFPVWKSKCLVKDHQAVQLSAALLQNSLEGNGRVPPVFLGLSREDGHALFAVDVSPDSGADGEGPLYPSQVAGAQWVDLRKEGPSMAADEAALLAYGRGLMEWHARNRFCARCGSPTHSQEGGHSLKCTSPSCSSPGYPRLDPAVIMLVTCGDFVLLGRQSRWEIGRYSLLAGFVELGETFEHAIVREVQEEAGVAVDPASIRYVASQPWPFPCSLMIGFNGQAVPNIGSLSRPSPANSGPSYGGSYGLEVVEVPSVEREAVLADLQKLPTPHADVQELEDARWLHKDFIRAVASDESPVKLPPGVQMGLPGQYAIARILLERWAFGGSRVDWAGADVAPVQIDTGVFKYVLLRASDSSGRSTLLVRGDRLRAFHMDIVDAARLKLSPLGLQVSQLGGGRIKHSPESKEIHVYGFSQAFGRADHEVTAGLLRRWYPFHNVSFSDEGY